jgi:hypothetical protein
MNLSKEVWQTLSAIDVSDHIEKKGNLSYLSWAWAYGTMMEHYPELHYSFEIDKCADTGTVEVSCVVHIHTGGEQDQVMMRHMWLPVMDHRNKAIPNPDKFAINSSKMRCLVKCFAMFGLGHHIYAGEDINPVVANAIINDFQAKELKEMLHECDADVGAFCNHFKCENPSKLLASQFDRAMHALRNKRRTEA